MQKLLLINLYCNYYAFNAYKNAVFLILWCSVHLLLPVTTASEWKAHNSLMLKFLGTELTDYKALLLDLIIYYMHRNYFNTEEHSNNPHI